MGIEQRRYLNDNGGNAPKFIFQMPSKLTFGLIISCLAIFLAQAATGSGAAGGSPLVQWGQLTFAGGQAFYQPWRWITYQYLHENGSHIFFNLLTIFFVVPAVEAILGWRWALALYTAGGIFAGVCFGLMTLVIPAYSLIGASASVLAMLGAMAALDPNGTVLAMMVIPVTWRVLAILYSIFYLLLVLGDRSHSDIAHLGGLAFGWIACLMYRRHGDQIMYSFRTRRQTRVKTAEKNELAEIERILDKVSAQGMNKLTRGEKKTLQRATDRQRKQDVAFGRR